MGKVPVLLLLGLAFLGGVDALPTLPEHLTHGAVGRSFRQKLREHEQGASPSHAPAPQHITVPLDHFAPTGGPTWQLKFYVEDSNFVDGGVILVTMPSEGALGGCGGGSLGKGLHAAALCSEHRYFGTSVPNGDSSTPALARYLSVEQNLADIAALITHARKSLYPTASAVVVVGGSYSGASAAWMRRTYPHIVDGAIAHSPPVAPVYDFYQYDVSNLIALSSPDSRCAHTQARVGAALTSLLGSHPRELMAIFGASHYENAPMGLVDFMYALGDSSASAIQYGRKSILCDALAPAYVGTAADSAAPKKHGTSADEDDDLSLALLFANYTRHAWGPDYFKQCFYNSSCMASATHGHEAQSARSWYHMKCAHLGYLQTAPQGDSLSARPKQLSVDKLIAQCKYIFGDEAELITPASIATFNAKFGGGVLGGEDRIFEINYSDDPWKMATTTLAVERQGWPLSFGQPFMLLTCDGCGHCGTNVSDTKREAITEQALAFLASWGIAPPKEVSVQAAVVQDTAASGSGDDLAVVAPEDPRITYHGRWAPIGGKAMGCAWPMSGFSFRVQGGARQGHGGQTNVSAKFAAPDDGARLLVRSRSVDASWTSKYLRLPAGGGEPLWHTLAPLAPQETLDIEVWKVSEDSTYGQGGKVGVLGLHGLGCRGGTFVELPPVRRAAAAGVSRQPRRLEFIGDSDTAGWCADGTARSGDNPDKEENAYETWAVRLARMSNVSEVMVEAISGYGVEPQTGQLQAYYTNTLAFTEGSPQWNFSVWVPDAVVVLIGPNDEAGKGKATASMETDSMETDGRGSAVGLPDSRSASSTFIRDYLELCSLVATSYIHAPEPPKLVHVCGGSGNGLDPCEDIQKASDRFNKQWQKSGMTSHYASINKALWHKINNPQNGYLGCDSHYGGGAGKGHAMLAADIAPQLATIMGW